MRKWEVIAPLGSHGELTRTVVQADSVQFGFGGTAMFFIAGEPVCEIKDYQFWQAATPEPPLWFDQLDERELTAIRHARGYAAQYSKAGAPGHSHMMLISKLCLLLEGETL